MTSKVSRKDKNAFATGFENSVEHDALESELKKRIFKSLRAALNKRIRQLNNEITPGSRKAAIESNSQLVLEARKCFRKDGPPDNIRDFIKRLDKDVLTRTYNAGGTISRSEKSVRDFLYKKFGIRGKPGRKPS